MPDYGAFRFTRVVGATPEAPDIYSPMQEGWVSPPFFEHSERRNWTPSSTPATRAYLKAAGYGDEIRAELAANNPSLLVLDREFETQSVDPMQLRSFWARRALRTSRRASTTTSPIWAAGSAGAQGNALVTTLISITFAHNHPLVLRYGHPRSGAVRLVNSSELREDDCHRAGRSDAVF